MQGSESKAAYFTQKSRLLMNIFFAMFPGSEFKVYYFGIVNSCLILKWKNV